MFYILKEYFLKMKIFGMSVTLVQVIQNEVLISIAVVAVLFLKKQM